MNPFRPHSTVGCGGAGKTEMNVPLGLQEDRATKLEDTADSLDIFSRLCHGAMVTWG